MNLVLSDTATILAIPLLYKLMYDVFNILRLSAYANKDEQ
jgi:hypothetical protein